MFTKVLLFLATALSIAFPTHAAAAPVGSETEVSTKCPSDRPWTDEVVATALSISIDKLASLQVARSLSNELICTMPDKALDRALWRLENPKPDSPGEWARFRAMQQSDETGSVKPNGLIEALAARRQIAARPRPAAPGAGLTVPSWQALGPGNIGGRVRALAIKPEDANVIFAGSVSGGLWRTTDAGVSWSPVNDFLGNLSISSIAFSTTNSSVMYAGTGEGYFNGDAVRGAGVFKSVDGGLTWSQLPSTNPALNTAWYFVNRVAVQAGNGNVLLAATNDGLYRSTDGGSSWSLVASGRAADVKFDPLTANNAVLAPGMHGGDVRYSRDGGLTWSSSNLTTTTASGPYAGRVEIAYSRQAGVLYASVDQSSGQVYRSTDGGVTWGLRATSGHLENNQGWYDNAIWVDPTDASHLIVGGIDLWRSLDGGLTWARISLWFLSESGSVHADHHAIVSSPAFDGSVNRTVYFGNDGGVYRAQDVRAVATLSGWTKLNNGLEVTQFYSGAGHNGTNGHIIGGTQDNGSLLYGGSGTNWSAFFGGDGGFSAVDPTNGNYIYGEYVYLMLHRSTNGGASQAIFINTNLPDSCRDDINYNCSGSPANFIAPFKLDPSNPDVMLAGGSSLWRSTNVKAPAPGWSQIFNGGGLWPYISQIAIAPGNSNVVWFGRNDGTLFKSTNATQPAPIFNQLGGTPVGRMVLSILIDRDDPNRVFVGLGGYSNQNLWRTVDGGSSWTSIGSGLPASPVRTIQRHPSNPSFLYVGTEVGIFTSEDGGATWLTSNDGPANVSVEELFWLDSSTLVAATHGRGMFKATIGGPYLLSVSKTGSGAGIVTSSPAGIDCGATCSANFTSGTTVLLTAAPAAGSTFAGWAGACTGTSVTCSVSMTQARTVTASFNAAYPLNVTKSGTGSGLVTSSPAGINCGATCSATFASGAQVALTAAPAAGSTFSGWSGGGCSGTALTCTVPMTAAQTVSAGFALSGGGLTLGDALGNTALSWASSGSAAWTAQTATFYTGGSAAKSGLITHSQVTTLSTTVTGPGTLSYWWKVSSEAGYDFLTFYIDGVAQSGRISGEVNWANQSWNIAAGTHTLEWRYSKDDSVNAGSDAGWLDAVSFTGSTAYPLNVTKSGTGGGLVTSSPAGINCGATCSATFASGAQVALTAAPAAGSTFSGWSGGGCSGTALTCTVPMTAAQTVSAGFALSGGGLTLGDALGNTALSWASSGSAAWTAQTATFYTGGSAAKSGLITHSQVTTLSTTVTGPGTLSYWWKVSSEAGYDFLTFYIDGVAQSGRISGEVNWANQSWNIAAGTHTLEWRYSKDDSVNAGSDAGWLDAVSFTGSTAYPLNVTKSGTGGGLVTSSPAGINCGATCSATFGSGAQVTLTAAPAAGSIFSGWSGGGCSGTALTCTVPMTAAQTVSAGFALSGGGLTLGDALGNTALSWASSGSAAWTAQTATFYTGGSAAKSGLITHSQVTTLSTTVTGPGTLSYWWKVSSEAGYDFLTFYIDGVAQSGRISGEVNWANQSWNIAAGTHTLEWRYSKDESVNAGSDAGWLDAVSFTGSTAYPLNVTKSGTGSGLVTSSPAGINCGATCSATFASGAQVALTAAPAAGSTFSGWSGGGCSGTALTCTVPMTAAQTVSAGFALSGGGLTLGDALGNTALSWASSGSAAWTAQTATFYTGGSAAKSGLITHSQVSTLSTTVTGPGTLSYWWKVSSEAGYDFLTFYIDGVAQSGRISGEVNWANQSWNIAAGTHTLEWRYSKDESVNAGSDAGWLDAVSFTGTAPIAGK